MVNGGEGVGGQDRVQSSWRKETTTCVNFIPQLLSPSV